MYISTHKVSIKTAADNKSHHIFLYCLKKIGLEFNIKHLLCFQFQCLFGLPKKQQNLKMLSAANLKWLFMGYLDILFSKTHFFSPTATQSNLRAFPFYHRSDDRC